MENTAFQQQTRELEHALIYKCWEDDSFKNQFMTNPASTLREFSNGKVEVPTGKTMVVNDQTDAKTIYINIPTRPEFSSMELTDEELENISGGTTPTCIYAGIFLVSAGLAIWAQAGE